MSGDRDGRSLRQRLEDTLAKPSFDDGWALAHELQTGRRPLYEEQLLVCRILARSMPAALPQQLSAQLVKYATSWLGSSAGASASTGSAAAVMQLQSEAAQLVLAMLTTAKAKLPPPASSQLLQQVSSLCQSLLHQTLASSSIALRDSDSIAARELLCSCLDLMARLPQWYPQPQKFELSAAVGAVASALEQQVRSGGYSSTVSLVETPATTRVLSKLLKALQVLLAEAKKEHGVNAASLAPALQRLFTYGWQAHDGSRGGSSGGGRAHSSRQVSLAGKPSLAAEAETSQDVSTPPVSGNADSGSNQGATAGKYCPPHARVRSLSSSGHSGKGVRSQHDQMMGGALVERGGAAANKDAQYSSESESSDVEGSSNYHSASRVRSAALACLQLLSKADPKSLHGSWTVLLPLSDLASSHKGEGGGLRGMAGAASAASTRTVNTATLVHLLLYDPQPRVRHAAAATIATLFEGPAQRAYLAVAEVRHMERQPIRGFLPLSASLGHMLVALHRDLLHSILHDSSYMVVATALRALGTLLLGAPYRRLPPQLLPMCVDALIRCLAKVPPPQPAAGGTLPLDQLPVASACLSCLAAAFSKREAVGAMAEQLLRQASATGGSTPSASTQEECKGMRKAIPASSIQPQQFLQLLFAYATCQQPALQLEAVMALRGVAQQQAVLLAGCWDALLALGSAGASMNLPAGPQGVRRGATDGTVPEKVAQQSIRLPGDYLQATAELLSLPDSGTVVSSRENASSIGGAESGTGGSLPADLVYVAGHWQQVVDQVLQAAFQHSSALLRAAAHAVVGELSPDIFSVLPSQLQQRLLSLCCAAASADEASTVRAAAMKAVGAMASAPAVCSLPRGLSHALDALAAGCSDSVLVVRISAANSLAVLCRMLSHRGSIAVSAPSTGQGMPASLEFAAPLLPICQRLAILAAGDNDKVRPKGLQALGSLFDVWGNLIAGQQQAAAGQAWFAAAAQVLQQCLMDGSAARVHWAACEAAGQLLACQAAPAAEQFPAVLRQLLSVLQTCPNYRSRALAAAALQQLAWYPQQAGLLNDLVLLLTEVAGVLFRGKASGFKQETDASEAPHAAPPLQQQQWPEPAEPGSKAQLEAALVAAVMHLTALAGTACACTRKGAVSSPSVISSGLFQNLRELVLQAQWELLSLPGSGSQHGQQHMLAAEGVMRQLVPSTALAASMLFDLSQATPELAAAAAEGLLLLKAHAV